MPSLPYWLFPGDDRPPEEIDDEVAEELRLHLDLLAEERMRQGVAPDQAKQQAAERFGDYDTLLRRCRLEKQGEIPMLKRIQAVLIGVLAAAVVAMGWQQWTMASRAEATWRVMNGISDRLSNIQDKLVLMQPDRASGPTGNNERFTPTLETNRYANVPLQPADPPASYNAPTPSPSTPAPPKASRSSYEDSSPPEESIRNVILVRDVNGDPVSHVTAYGIHSRRERQSGISELTSGEDGRIEWNQTSGSAILGVVVNASGYASVMHLFSEERSGDHAVTVTLKKASPFELRVTQPDGKPARRMSVVPIRRTDLEDNSHDLPADERSLWSRTDDDGRVTIDWLEAGDLATLRLKERGRPIDSAITVEFEAPRDPSKVVLITITGRRSGSSGGEFGGGGGGFRDRSAYEVQVGEEADEPTEKPSRRRGRGGRGGGEFGGGDFWGGGFGGDFGGGDFGGSVKDSTATRTQNLLERREFALGVLQQEQAKLSKAQRAVDTAMQARVAKAERTSGVAVKQRDAAKAKLTAASTDYERTKKLFAEGLTSELKSQLAEQRRREADAALAAASAAVADADSKLLADRNAQLASSKGYGAQIQKIQASIRKAETEVAQAKQAKLELLKAQASSEESDKTKANESPEDQ